MCSFATRLCWASPQTSTRKGNPSLRYASLQRASASVNKAYHVLRQEGFIRLDRRNGAVIFLQEDKHQAIQELRESFQVILAKAVCKNISREEIHGMVDEIFDEYEE